VSWLEAETIIRGIRNQLQAFQQPTGSRRRTIKYNPTAPQTSSVSVVGSGTVAG
jgi:hypothetical protein